jgi:hypothetical protein
VAAILLLYIGIDHALFNAEVSGNAWAAVAQFRGLRNLLWLMPLAALAVAGWFDLQRDSDANEPALAAEQATSFRLRGTLKASVRGFPWSLSSVDKFVRLHRAHNSERPSGFAEVPDGFGAVAVQARDRVNEMQPFGSRPTGLLGLAQRYGVIVRFVLMVPPLVWFVVGGWPQTAWLQMTMIGPVVWKVVVALSVISQAWIAWQVIIYLRSLSKVLRLSIADDAVILALRTACGVGAIGLGGYALARAFSGLSPSLSLIDNVQVQAAFAQAASATSMHLANGATGAAPAANVPVQAAFGQAASAASTHFSNGATGAAPAAGDEGSHAHHKTAVESWMQLFYGTPNDPGFLQIHPDDGTGMKLARAAGIVGTLPIWGTGLFAANAIDEFRSVGPFHFRR